MYFTPVSYTALCTKAQVLLIEPPWRKPLRLTNVTKTAQDALNRQKNALGILWLFILAVFKLQAKLYIVNTGAATADEQLEQQISDRTSIFS